MDTPDTSSARVPDKNQTHIVLPPFLSVARGQAFDMLLHLSLNLSQPILVSGSTGIGKTRFLRALEKQAAAYATTCYLTPTAGLSLDRLLDTVRLKAEIELQASGNPPPPANDIHSLLEVFARNRRNLLLILDDGEGLLPGFLDALGQYSQTHPALKWVVALGDKGLLEKRVSDPFFIGEAFELEIPPLDRNASAAYVRQWMAESPAFLPGETLGDVAQEDIFRATHGNPGQIDLYMEQPRQPNRGSKKTIPVGALAGTGLLIAVMAGLTLYFGRGLEISPPPKDSPILPVPPKAEKAEPDIQPVLPSAVIPPVSKAQPLAPTPAPVLQPEASSPVAVDTGTKETGEKQTVDVTPAVKPELALQSQPPSEAEAVQKPKIEPQPSPASPLPFVPQPQSQPEPKKVEPAPPPQSAKEKPVAEPAPIVEPSAAPKSPTLIGDGQWIAAQKPETYTLQVATVGSFPQAEKVVSGFPAGRDWSAAVLRLDGRERYQVFQGVYPNAAAALEARSRWPGRGNPPLVRSFASIQQDLARQPASSSPLAVMPVPAPEPAQAPASTTAPRAVARKLPARRRVTPVVPPAGTEPAVSLASTVVAPVQAEQQRVANPSAPETSMPASANEPASVLVAESPVSEQDNPVEVAPLAEEETLQIDIGSQVEEPARNAAEAEMENAISQGKEIYYRLVEGQAPMAEIVDSQAPSANLPSTLAPPPSEPGLSGTAAETGISASVPAATATPPIGDAAWLLAQPPERYTLQVITVSSTRSRDEVARRLLAETAVASYPARREQGTVYPLFYGNYPDLVSAQRAMALIPNGLGKPLPRQFKAIQREMAQHP